MMDLPLEAQSRVRVHFRVSLLSSNWKMNYGILQDILALAASQRHYISNVHTVVLQVVHYRFPSTREVTKPQIKTVGRI